MPASARLARGLGRVAAVAALALGVCACGSTTDSLGYDNTESATLQKVTGPASYPNPFRDLLGQSDANISSKINNAFNTLFHGSTTYSFYTEVGTDQATITDTLHGDIRTEGMGLGMMICVQMNKEYEFGKLWTYAKEVMQVGSGPNAGYFNSFCNDVNDKPIPCLDPYGFQQFVTALIFANDRWGSTGAIDYAADALALFHTVHHKVDDNGGIVDGVTDLFDPQANLPLEVPNVSSAGVTRPPLVMPAYQALWAQADADPTFTKIATAGRAFWQSAANPMTGFMAVRTDLSGTPSMGWATFDPEAYRSQINVAIDQIWSGGNAWNVTESNKLLAYFSAQGINTYGRIFSLDGTVVDDNTRDPSLIAANGVTAVASTNTDRSSYVSAVWNMDVPTGNARYYAGLLYIIGLLVLSGQFQIY
ncbi:MAG TPA: glycosyl hydrolase family 8 [Polyangia bacterium]|nr:glycosyl hydrolase family 8 [Polyangia bacterium]